MWLGMEFHGYPFLHQGCELATHICEAVRISNHPIMAVSSKIPQKNLKQAVRGLLFWLKNPKLAQESFSFGDQYALLITSKTPS